MVSTGAPARYAQLQEEAALLADVSAAQPVRIRAAPVRTAELPGGRHRWHHVVHVPEAVHARATLLARSLGAGTYDLLDSTHTVASVVHAALERGRAAGEAWHPSRLYALAVGSYGDGAEFSLSRYEPGLDADVGGSRRPEWHFALHAAGGAPADAAYFAAALLENIALSPEDVGRVYLYGDQAEPERHADLATVFGQEPRPLDPMPLFGRRPEGVPASALAAFAPCLGAVVR